MGLKVNWEEAELPMVLLEGGQRGAKFGPVLVPKQVEKHIIPQEAGPW